VSGQQAEGDAEASGVVLQRALARVLRWSARRESRRLLYGEAAQELSQNDVWLLDAVDSNGPVRLSDLAASKGVDKSTITPQVRRLEEQGLLERRTGMADRRVALLAITRRGRLLQQRRAAAGAALVGSLLRDWRQEDQQAFAQLFTRFAEQLDTHPAANPKSS